MKKFKQHIKVGKFDIGSNHTFIIAEVGINHQGSVATAKKMIDAIVASGADAVKFQAFKTDDFVGDKKQTYTYESQGKSVTEPMYDMFKRYEFSEKDFQEVFAYAKSKKILCFATPQNISDMHLVLKLGVPLLKVGSDDLTNLPLMEAYARTKLPVIISTGMADMSDIKDAVEVFRKVGNDKLVVLHCISSYPASDDELNLLRINTIRDTFAVITGFSDHSNGNIGAIGSVALGAKVIEKHFTLDKNMPGPDHRFSASPAELTELVCSVRAMELALGSPTVAPSKKEKEMRILARRSIVARRSIAKGEKITADMIEYKRPGNGLMPKYTHLVLGKRARRAIALGTLLKRTDVA
jgi:sialic acid synthase SpsE